MSGFSATARRDAWLAVVGTRGWTLSAAMALLSGLPLLAVPPRAGVLVDLSPVFSIAAWCVLVGAALAGAAAASRERRQGTWDLVLAAPGDPSSSVWGLWAGLLATVAVLQSAPLLVALVAYGSAPVDMAAVAGGVTGLWLAGCVAASLGVLAGVAVGSGLGSSVTSLLLVGVWISVARSLQALGDPWFGAVGYALDPVRRVQEFASGGFASGGLLAMAAASLVLAWVAAEWADAERLAGRGSTWRARGSAAAIGLAVAASAVVALRGPGADSPRLELHAVFRGEPGEALRRAVAAARGPIELTLFTAKGSGDAAVFAARHAIDRAAACVDAGGGSPTWREVDLVLPVDAGRAAQAMQGIQAAEDAGVRAWREAFDAGLACLGRVSAAPDLAVPLQQMASTRPQGDLLAVNLVSLASGLQRAANEGRQWREAFDRAAAGGPDRPLGDVEGAARSLAIELGGWARMLREAADAAGRGSQSAMRGASRRLAELSDACRAAQDAIDRLPPLGMTEVAAAMRSPPLVVVTTPRGAAAVPAWRLLESADAADAAMAAALSAAEGAPRDGVVIVHAMPRSPLEATATGADMAFVSEALRGSRFRVEAWNPSQSPRPALRGSQRRAWIVLPPLSRTSLEPDAAEQALLLAARRLLQDGEPVLLLVAPSVAASMGMGDPWAGLLGEFGLTASSGEMVVRLQASSESGRALVQGLDRVQPGEHPVASAVAARAIWPMAVPLRMEPVTGVEASVVVRVPEDPSTWIEDDPRTISRGVTEVPAAKVPRPGAVVPLLATARRGPQRVAMSGGMGWVLSQSAGVADARGLPAHPGNRDLLVGTVRWLVGDGSLVSSSVPDAEGRGLFAVAWLPTLLLLVVRIGVSAWRRRA